MTPISPIPPALIPHGVDPGPPDGHHAASGAGGCLGLIFAMPILAGLMFSFFGYMAISEAKAKPSDVRIGQIVIACVGLPLIACGVALVAWHRNAGSMEVWTSPGGIAWRSSFAKGFATWDQVDKLYRLVVEVYVNGRYSGTRISLNLVTKSGASVTFREFVTYVLDLGDRIEREVVQRQLPGALSALASGVPVHFDKLAISRDGLAYGKHQLPWAEVEELKVEGGHVTIRKAGKFFKWADLRVGDVPNFGVFQGVVRALAGGGKPA